MPKADPTAPADYYARLGVPATATSVEIRTAFRARIADAMDDQPRFAALTEAFETLKDPTKRAQYDAGRQKREPVMSTTPPPPPDHPATPVAPAPLPAVRGNPAAQPCPMCRIVSVPDEGFCPECGLLLGDAVAPAPDPTPRPRLVDAIGREFTLHVGENIVGREGADVMVPDKTVSRRHARLTVSERNDVVLEDLGSTNGTRHESDTITPGQRVILTDGASVTFGSVRLTLLVPPPPALALPAADDSTRAPIAALGAPRTARAVLIGGDGTLHVLSSVETTFGRKATNDIVLIGDAFVSGAHASIVYEGGGYRLVDLGSTNGTRLNGRKITPKVPESLSDGDTIQFGHTQYTFQGPNS